MSDLAKKAREAMKAKAKRLGSDRPLQKVDSSTFVPPELLNADVKTGLRPVSRRAYKSGGKVEGACGPTRADRKARKNGGEATSYANAKINRNVKDANELREGKKHVGGLKRGGRAGKEEGGGLYEGNKRVVSPTAPRAEPESKLPKNPPLPPRRPADLPRDEGMTAAEAEKFMKSRKAGGRAKKNIGGVLKYLSPIAMLASLGDDDDKKKAHGGRAKHAGGGRTKTSFGREGLSIQQVQALNDAIKTEKKKHDEKVNQSLTSSGLKHGGRAKKQMGGPMAAGNAILQGSAAASGVPQDRMSFAPGMPSQGVKKYLGLKKGGKAEHLDEAMDKALIKKMVKAEARTGKMKGGETFSGKSYPGKVPGVVAGGRMARKDGGRAKKGKTNINIVIQAGKPETAGMDVMNPLMKQPAPPPPAPPIMPPPGAPPVGGPPPGMPPMPPGGAPGMPPMMGRKTGGRVSKEASSYKDMTAGAGSGEGRLQKTDIAKRSNRRAGGKVYRSYKDMDAGAGSGLGRLEKTEIQSRK